MTRKLLTVKNRNPDSDDIMTPNDVLFLVDGEEFYGIKSAKIKFDINEFVQAKVVLWSKMDQLSNVLPRFWMKNPKTGIKEQVVSITFKDSGTYDF